GPLDDRRDWDLETGQQWRAQDAVSVVERFPPEAVPRVVENLDRLPVRIRNPHLADAESRVALRFRESIPPTRSRRKDLDDEVRSVGDELLADDREPARRNEKNVRLQDVETRQDDVARSVE